MIIRLVMITADGGGAGSALLGIKVAEAVETVGEVISRGEPLASQLLLAAGAQEAVLVPGLVMIGHPTSGDGLIAESESDILSHIFLAHTGDGNRASLSQDGQEYSCTLKTSYF